MAKQRWCVFCHENQVTREHVWPQWAAALFPIPPGRTFTQERISSSGQRALHAAPSIEVKVRRVCAKCNNGWMSRLETAASPYLRPMFAGQPQALDCRAQALVACWAVKTALMFQYVNPEPYYVPETPYRELYANRDKLEPPTSMQVVAGRYIGPHLLGTFYQQPLTAAYEEPECAPIEAKAYGMTLGIGQFLVQIFGHELSIVRPDLGIRLMPDEAMGQQMLPIWPQRDDIVSWPPLYGVSDATLDDVRLAFTRVQSPPTDWLATHAGKLWP